MSTSIGANSKVYLFLARTERTTKKDWNEYADSKYGNGDGVVSHAEFVDFIRAEYSSAMGEDLYTSDMNIFWSSVDTDTVTFKNNTRDVKGAYNLSSKEIDAMEKNINEMVVNLWSSLYNCFGYIK